MSANAAIFNPTESTSAATGDGFSVPRLTTTGRLAITFGTGDKGMMVYDVTLNSLFIWNGTAWEHIDGTGTSSNTQVLFNDNGATAGDPTMVFDKNTDTLTVQNLVVTGTTTALGGENASSIRAAASDYAAVTFDGATASTRIASAGQAIGTGDFSLWSRFLVPTSIPSSQFPGILNLSDSSTTSTRANALRVLMTDSGTFQVSRLGTTTSDSRTASISNFRSTYSGQIVDVVVTRAGATLKIYINGTDTTYTEATGGTPPAWSDTVVSDFVLIGCSTSSATTIFSGRIYRSVVFNRALSASDVTELITTGVNPADQWGSQTAAYTSDFSAGADGWGATRGTVAGNIDGISGVDDTLRLTVDTTASNSHYASKTVTGLLAGKRYRVGFNYFITAANATMNGLALWQLTTQMQRSTVQSVTGAWTSITPVEFVSTESRLDVLGYAGASNSFTGNGTDTFYLHSFVVTRIGAIVDLDFTVGTGFQATDRSTNQLNGTLFNGVEFTQPKRTAVLYASTQFLGNSRMLNGGPGSILSIPNNAIIQSIVVYDITGGSTIFVGELSGGNTIVASTVLTVGYNFLTIVTPRASTGQLWVNCTANDPLVFSIAYTLLQP